VGKINREWRVRQGMFDCVRVRERETNKWGRERESERGRGGEEIVGRGRCMREREEG
jgi:hypothetical protein